MAPLRAKYLYTSDDGNQYRVLIPVWLGSLAAPSPGFAADDTSKGALPRYMKMRYVTAIDSTTGKHRKIHAGTVGSALYATLNTSVTLPMIDGTEEVFVTDGRVGEKLRGI